MRATRTPGTPLAMIVTKSVILLENALILPMFRPAGRQVWLESPRIASQSHRKRPVPTVTRKTDNAPVL